MDISRRKFIEKSLLLGSSVSFAGYALGRNGVLVAQKVNRNMDNIADATYANTQHNRQFYASARF